MKGTKTNKINSPPLEAYIILNNILNLDGLEDFLNTLFWDQWLRFLLFLPKKYWKKNDLRLFNGLLIFLTQDEISYK